MSKKIIIGVSGNQGSFSEEAANYYCRKYEIVDYELNYLLNVGNVLTSLNNGDIDLGVFPVENSNASLPYYSRTHFLKTSPLFQRTCGHSPCSPGPDRASR